MTTAGPREPSSLGIGLALAGATAAGLVLSVLRARAGTADLWFDDAWVAIATRTSIDGATRLNGAPGFTVLARWWIGVGGGRTAWTQTLALVPYLAVAPVVYWAGLRTCRSRGSAVVVACAAVLAPVLITESARVKQYTLECLLSAVMVGLAAGAAHLRPSLRRTVAAAVVVVVGVALSGALVLPGGVLLVVLGVQEIRTQGPDAAGRGTRLLILGASVAAVFAWVLLVLSRVSYGYNATWRAYGAFVGTPGTVTGTARQLVTMTRGFVGGFVPGGSAASVGSVLEVVLLLGLAVYTVRRWRAVWWLLLAPGAAIVASAAQRYPLGPIGFGRVDSWLLPWIAALAAQALTDSRRMLGRRVAPARLRAVAVPVLVGTFVLAAVAAAVAVTPYPPTRIGAALEVLESPPAHTRAYVVQEDMPVLLALPGPGRLVRTSAREALNSTRFIPARGVRVLSLRPEGRRQSAAELGISCGGTVVVVGASDQLLLPVERRLPCPVVRRERRTEGTNEHWDDIVTLHLGARREPTA